MPCVPVPPAAAAHLIQACVRYNVVKQPGSAAFGNLLLGPSQLFGLCAGRLYKALLLPLRQHLWSAGADVQVQPVDALVGAQGLVQQLTAGSRTIHQHPTPKQAVGPRTNFAKIQAAPSHK
jgi:hypothetical protein